jgi:hypothetical protein
MDAMALTPTGTGTGTAAGDATRVAENETAKEIIAKVRVTIVA